MFEGSPLGNQEEAVCQSSKNQIRGACCADRREDTWRADQKTPRGARTLQKIATGLSCKPRDLTDGLAIEIEDLFEDHLPRGYLDDLRDARELFICGLNLVRVLPANRNIFETILAKTKGKIFAVLLDPAVSSYGAIQEYGKEADVAAYKKTIYSALNELYDLKANHGKSSLQIRTTTYPFAYGLDIIDPNQSHSFAYVRFYPICKYLTKMPTSRHGLKYGTCEDQPILKLHRGQPEDKYWYTFYKRQFFALWDIAADWSPAQRQSRK
jgi:hypothetical protein